MILNVFKVFVPVVVVFALGIWLTPLLTHYLYKYKLWKKRPGKVDPTGRPTPLFNELHRKREVGTPRFGGVIIWASTLLTVFGFWLLSQLYPTDLTQKLNFLSRNQTWIPAATLLVASLVGLADDWLQVSGRQGGLSFWKRLLIVLALGTLVAWWFFVKLEMSSVFIPFFGELELGYFFIPFFLLVLASLFSSGVVDGLDGLAGGLLAIIFMAYAVIAFFQEQIDLAAFSAVVAGATLAFLWFNIPPARFYMSETGILGLTTTLTTVAFLTNTVIVLPLIALPLTVTSLSVIIQLLSKKFRGKKVFKIAPLHHHFEAVGWPAYKVVMRYWVIGIISAIAGLIIALIGR